MPTLYEFEKTLSPARKRAFSRAQRELADRARGDKWRELSRKSEEARMKFIREHWQEIEAIRQEADRKEQEIKAQIKALYDEQTRVRDEAREAESAITIQAYDTPEYKEARALESEAWKADEVIYQEKLKALMDKYAQAQGVSA